MSLQDSQTSNWYFSDFKFITFHDVHKYGLSILFFFFLILLVAFFFFYFVCKSNCFLSEGVLLSPPPREAVLVQINKGLDEESLQKLPIFLFGDETCKDRVKELESECPICLGLFKDDEMVKLLPDCEHVYHAQCIDKWLIAHSNCPLCRASLHLNSITISEITT